MSERGKGKSIPLPLTGRRALRTASGYYELRGTRSFDISIDSAGRTTTTESRLHVTPTPLEELEATVAPPDRNDEAPQVQVQQDAPPELQDDPMEEVEPALSKPKKVSIRARIGRPAANSSTESPSTVLDTEAHVGRTSASEIGRASWRIG